MGIGEFFFGKTGKQKLVESERKKRLALEEEQKHERRKLEETQREMQRLSEDVVWFKRMMSHNIRMPLAIIAGYGELLANESFSGKEEELECVKIICKNIDYLGTLTKVLLDNDQEGVLTEKGYFDVLGCVREVSEYVKTIARKAGIKISVISSRETVMLYGNRISLMRAFFNLIENSVRYMNRQGNVFITVEETESEVLIVYRDDGEGMSSEEAEYITQLNYQGSNKKREGHGLGMYLIEQAILEQGGSLEIKTGQGSGMGIYMAFPIKRQENL